MKIPVVAPVTFTIPSPDIVKDGTPTTAPPLKVAVTVAEAFKQTDTEALTLREGHGNWALAEFKLPKLKSRTNIINLNLSKPVPNLLMRFRKRKLVDRCECIVIDCWVRNKMT